MKCYRFDWKYLSRDTTTVYKEVIDGFEVSVSYSQQDENEVSVRHQVKTVFENYTISVSASVLKKKNICRICVDDIKGLSESHIISMYISEPWDGDTLGLLKEIALDFIVQCSNEEKKEAA